ncbi:hypothetical protein M3182_01590 [Mesobacillus maritimus]|uniref:hypothetical protein n=1 Tax=Mesobacillus maritimus TaxID=1643336 RepID=UPI00203D5227|nr:hypothetical protein [Mesobacillus maritimus]MCM3584433.1 hypothetical protein [Mesobacillus maritimus]MCM3670834.1 hypothetical protein [Mesobacillus maritimus]
MSLEEQPLTADRTFSFDELEILIHEEEYVYFDHTKLDYVQDPLGSSRFQLLKV